MHSELGLAVVLQQLALPNVGLAVERLRFSTGHDQQAGLVKDQFRLILLVRFGRILSEMSALSRAIEGGLLPVHPGRAVSPKGSVLAVAVLAPDCLPATRRT